MSNDLNRKLFHFSTDYVFGNTQNRPFIEIDSPAPLSVYGTSKLLGESNIVEYCKNYVIIRSSWIYSSHSRNFFNTVKNIANQHDEMRVVFDQVGSPCFSYDLAELIYFLCEKTQKDPLNQVYHYSNEGVCSWYDLAHKIVKKANLNLKVVPIQSIDYPAPATRPFFSLLDKTKIKKEFGISINHWEESLENFLKSNQFQ